MAPLQLIPLRGRTYAKHFKTGALTLALLGLAWSVFHVLRARHLLANARQIAAQSAGFPRDYFLGSGPPVTYLVMGDSTAAGWGAGDWDSSYPHQIARTLAARGFRVHVVGVAKGGATLQQVRREQSGFLAQLRPDFVSLSVGANDATHGTDRGDYGRDWQWLLRELGASSARAVWVANVPDMFLAPALPLPLAGICGRRARALNRILNSVPKNPKVKVIDLFGRGKLDPRADGGLYAADGFHPSGRGYGMWARLFCEVADSGLESPKAR